MELKGNDFSENNNEFALFKRLCTHPRHLKQNEPLFF